MISKQLQIPHWNKRVWSQILLWSRMTSGPGRQSCQSHRSGWWCPPKNLSQRGTLQSAGLRHHSEKHRPESFIFDWALQYSARRNGIYKLPFWNYFFFLSSYDIKDTFCIKPATDLFFLLIPQLNTMNYILLRCEEHSFKWNDIAVSRRTKFALIQENPPNAHHF